ncbi:S-adenosylmethionine decarboxylase family protein [Pendulispora albinea]|uniref:S-adenosylmethionine decarboxylase n=1 Tax=Pendulispora albinea TaxID=2741071 RepID=A0ABZ2LKB7_9BACT
MRLGTEWIVDASGCDPEKLRDPTAVDRFVDAVIEGLALTVLPPRRVHRFPGEGGITALVLLTESHLALHTFPEHGALTVNLYCCRERPPYAWEAALHASFGAARVHVVEAPRGVP